MFNKISNTKFYFHEIPRLAIVEQENRQIEREIDEILNQGKTDETKSIKSIVNNINISSQPQTGYRRIPGSISSLI
jgi:translation initiation factor 2 beta subunit (eIF-2beta)/eIF-5